MSEMTLQGTKKESYRLLLHFLFYVLLFYLYEVSTFLSKPYL